MGTKNCPGDFDCYANAEDDEPMFVLLARDASAPELVREWVNRRAIRKGYPAPDAKALEALRCADAMEAWQAGIRPGGPKAQARARELVRERRRPESA